jgi:hypothetical protein
LGGRVAALSEITLTRLASIRVVGPVTGAIPPVVGVIGGDVVGRELTVGAIRACVLGPNGSAICSWLRVRPREANDGEGGVIGANGHDGDLGGCGPKSVELIEVDEGLLPLLSGPVALG